MGNIIQKKDKIFITVIPIFMGIIAFVIMRFYGLEKIFSETTDVIEICKAMVGLWGTLLGFIITAVSILVALDTDKGIIRVLKESNHFNTVLYTFLKTGILLLVGIIFAVAIIYLNINSQLIYLIVGAVIVAEFVSLSICIYFMFYILIKHS